MRVRGLKLYELDGNTSGVRVAPHAGAWIETNKPEAVHQL